MFKILKRMVGSQKYTTEYIKESIEVFYLVGKLTKEEYLEIKSLISEEKTHLK